MAFMKLCMIAVAFAATLSGQAPNLAVTSGASKVPVLANPNEVVLTVGEHKITGAQYQFLVKMLLPAQSQELAYGPGRRQFAQKIAEVIILADEALKNHLDTKPDLALQLKFHDDNILALAMFQKVGQTLVITDADIQAYYDSHKSDYEQLNARRILIRVKGAPVAALPGKPELTDAEAHAKAAAIRQQLIGGGDFAKLAQQESDDAASRQQGGDMGQVKRGATVLQFEQAAFSLKPGEISDPVKTVYGYDVIQVQSRSIRNLADVKEDVTIKLKPIMTPQAVEALINKTKFDISDSYFGPVPAAPAK